MESRLTLAEAVLRSYRRGLEGIDRIAGTLASVVGNDGATEAALMAATIAPNFPSLGAHLHDACVHAYADIKRVIGEDAGRPEPISSLGELARYARWCACFLDGLDARTLDGARDRTLDAAGETFTGDQFLLHSSLPHFYFHISAALFILRERGFDAGEPVFLWDGPEPAEPYDAHP